MKINNKSISTFNATQHKVTFGRSYVNNDSEWLPGAVLPVFTRSTVGFKELTIVLVVKGSTREAIIQNVSKIVAECVSGQVELSLDNYAHTFVGVMKKEPKHIEAVQRKWHKLELTFSCYERSAGKKTATLGTSTTIQNNGTMTAPAKITIVAKQNINNMTISGLSRNKITGKAHNIVVPSILTGHTIVIDGMSGLITDNGSPRSIDCLDLPSLNVGSNTIKLSHDSSYATFSLEYFETFI